MKRNYSNDSSTWGPIKFGLNHQEVNLIVELIGYRKGCPVSDCDPGCGPEYDYVLYFKIGTEGKNILVPGEMYYLFHEAVIEEIEDRLWS